MLAWLSRLYILSFLLGSCSCPCPRAVEQLQLGLEATTRTRARRPETSSNHGLKPRLPCSLLQRANMAVGLFSTWLSALEGLRFGPTQFACSVHHRSQCLIAESAVTPAWPARPAGLRLLPDVVAARRKTGGNSVRLPRLC